MEEILGRELPHHSYSSFIKMLSKYVNKYDRQDKMFFIGYNARFDFDFMRAWFEKCGDKYFGSWFYFPPIDVMNQAIIQLIHERHLLPNFKLQTVADYLKIEADGKYHDALKDIDITEKLFFKFIGKGEIQL
jgi:DNA polymerase-3 subunit epsilon